MRKIVGLLLASILILMGLGNIVIPVESHMSVSSTNEHGIGAIFKEPEQDKIVDHIYPENGAPDVRRDKSNGENTVSSVDNSYYLPPVGDQGYQGSCVAWSMGYYHKGYEENKEHDWTGSEKYDPAHQMSPAFVYNHANGGQDGGLYFSDAASLIVDMGIATMKDMPYDDSDYTTWPDTRTYFDALQYRASDYHWIYVGDDDGIDNLKQHLANGNTAVLGIYVWGNFDNIGDYNYTYCVADETGNNRGGHGVCVIGYDDNKETHDGKGAFKLVNSWGTGWGDNGFWWMSYEAVKNDDLSQKWVIYLDDRTDYHPKTVAELKIDHTHRGDIMKEGIEIGTGTGNNKKWSHSFMEFYMLNHVGDSNYQRYPFPKNTMVFDLTDGISSLPSDGEDFFVGCEDTINGTTGSLRHFEVHYLPEKSSWYSSEEPKSIPDNTDSQTFLNMHLDSGGEFHAPIRIDSDHDFYELRGVFSGNGTNNNPYIIEKYDINAVGRGNGIYLGNTTAHVRISNCTLHDATGDSGKYHFNSGIFMYRTSNVTLLNSTISENGYGIYLDSSEKNLIYHNNLIKNLNQSYDNSGSNFWNSSYPTGGNYWSDYGGTDIFSGPAQNKSGSDGIGDTEYTNISGGGGAQDNYPLMQPAGLMKIDLNAGWNLISLPWEKNPVNITRALNDISWDRAMVYINGTWHTYNKNRNAKYNAGFPTVDNTIGIWVHCPESTSLFGSDKDIGSTSIPLHKGWTLVGFPTGHDHKVSSALSGIPWEHLETSDANGDTYALSYEDYMLAGKAYWIYVDEDCVWTVEW